MPLPSNCENGCSRWSSVSRSFSSWVLRMVSCMEDRVRDGTPDLALLLPLRNAEGHICGFYEQGIEDAADSVWSEDFLPLWFQASVPTPSSAAGVFELQPPGFSSGSGTGRAALGCGFTCARRYGLARICDQLDPGEYHDRLSKFLMCTREVIWPIHQSELSVGFVRDLLSLPIEAIARLTLLLLPEGEDLPGLLRREGTAALQTRLAGAVSVRGLVWW